jgi:hypothetical protein
MRLPAERAMGQKPRPRLFGLRGPAPILQATTRSGGSFRIELPPLASGLDFWCKAGCGLALRPRYENHPGRLYQAERGVEPGVQSSPIAYGNCLREGPP